DDADPTPETRHELERLAERYALVAVVSGRDGDDVRRRVGVDGVVCVGSHGLELDPAVEQWRRPVRDFAERVDWRDTELKAVSVSFHFRNAPDECAARVDLERVAADAERAGLRARFGRTVLEVLADVRARLGVPSELHWEGEISEVEWSIATHNPARRHDVTLFIVGPGGRLALIRKPHFAEDVWRPPGGGVRPGEGFLVGAVRE